MIDILLATYNGAQFLEQQLDSIFNQSVSGWRIIAHDDGSNDCTLDILLSFQSRFPEKLRVIQDNIKFGSAKENFVHLIGYATADYVMFCDQDDVWLPHKIEVTYTKMKAIEDKDRHIPCIVHTDLTVVNQALEVIHPSMFSYQCLPQTFYMAHFILVQNFVTGCTMLVNRAAIHCALPVAPSAIMHDWWIAARVLLSGGKIELIPQATILYRQHANNSVGSKKITAFYYLKQLTNVKNVFNAYSPVFNQSKDLGFRCYVCFIFMNAIMITSRILLCRK
ncbi:MAG: glycosyltransferase family 2 protein [Gammaproteobacteria bacterium]|nr:glycosyltransferase family 2 protein [Gammaproteobacteria bacterium]